jgi:hypothetical protein
MIGGQICFIGKTKNRQQERLEVTWMGLNKMNRQWRRNKLLTRRKFGKWVQVIICSKQSIYIYNYYHYLINGNIDIL